MATAAVPAQYPEWIEFFFGRDIDDPFAANWAFPADSEDKAWLFVETMQRGAVDLAHCSDARLAIGLQALTMGHISSLPYDIIKASDPAKVAVTRSFGPLYLGLLAPRSGAVLGHLSEGAGSPLSYVTYMLWDVTPFTVLVGLRDATGARSLLVMVLAEVLLATPANPAVTESVLHGFGHMLRAEPRHAGQIREAIDKFLATRPIGRPELCRYAELARAGAIQ